jgi:carboxymethylenebutenolidase
MPIYNPDHVEYRIVNGHIRIAMEDGSSLPAYWAHPAVGNSFPGVALIHDWWGITPIVRRMAHLFAQVGYYVIVPDLFDEKVASTPQEAMQLVEALGDGGYPRVHTALTALEQHHHCNRDVAAVGIGMGGSLAFEAAITRADLEAAIAYYGFPQRYFGLFKDAKAPILAFYGSNEPYVLPNVVERLRHELDGTTVAHEVVDIDGAGHDFYSDNLPDDKREFGRRAWHRTLTFLEEHLTGPTRPPDVKTY